MPELPEVEHVRRTLEMPLAGARVMQATLHRRDIVRNAAGQRITPNQLFVGSTIQSLERYGKNLIIIARTGRVICVHLGMSGQLIWQDIDGCRIKLPSHSHCTWKVQTRTGEHGLLIFRDPRRFGGLWIYESLDALKEDRLQRLGPDALHLRAPALGHALGAKKTSIKAALLDQRVLAGVGNIYADEALFRAGIHPGRAAGSLSRAEVAALATAIRSVLRRAIVAGGSTIQSFTDSHGRPGRYVQALQVYGRGGEPCLQCGRKLLQTTVGQRTTVSCPGCQQI